MGMHEGRVGRYVIAKQKYVRLYTRPRLEGLKIACQDLVENYHFKRLCSINFPLWHLTRLVNIHCLLSRMELGQKNT